MSAMGVVELVATAFGLACVWLTVRQNIGCWPTGLVMVALYLAIFWDARLYSDMGLQGVYVVLQLYGWHYWLHGGRERAAAPVTRAGPSRTAAWLAVGLAGTAGLGWVMATHTDADLPYWDAATTALSLVAQWLMAKKVLESWLFWIAVDVLAVGVYLAKGLYPTTALYAVFLGLAMTGLLAWRRSMRGTLAAEPAVAAHG